MTNITGENIRKYRKDKGLTQKELAEDSRVKISVRTLQKYETGEIDPPTKKINKIAAALGVTPTHLTIDNAILEALSYITPNGASEEIAQLNKFNPNAPGVISSDPKKALIGLKNICAYFGLLDWIKLNDEQMKDMLNSRLLRGFLNDLLNAYVSATSAQDINSNDKK